MDWRNLFVLLSCCPEFGRKIAIFTSCDECLRGLVGSEGYEAQDAKTFADWGVDYLKYDNCNHDEKSARVRYTAMADALNSTGRPICFAMCSWGEDQVWAWGGKVANSWRMASLSFLIRLE